MAIDVENKEALAKPAVDGLKIHLKERNVGSFRKRRCLLKDIDLWIPAGSLVLLLGGSGSGKTTFVNAITGYEKADAVMLLNGQDIYKDYDRMKSNVMEEVKRIFKPEFINRIDEIMVFHALSKPELTEITALLGKNLAKRCQEQLQIKLTFSKGLKEHLVEKYSDPKMGARPLKRAIQNLVEDRLAEEILSGRILRGDTVRADIKDNEAVFKVKETKLA